MGTPRTGSFFSLLCKMRENLIRFQDKICPGFLAWYQTWGAGACQLFTSYSSHIRARIFESLRSPGIDSASLCSLAGRYDYPICRTGPPALQRLAESIPCNRFLGSLNVYKFGLWEQEKTRWPCSLHTDSYPPPRSLRQTGQRKRQA